MLEVGDKVRYVPENDPLGMLAGYWREVFMASGVMEVETLREFNLICLITNRGRSPGWHNSRFELVEPAHFKVGDVVRLREDRPPHWNHSGHMDHLLGTEQVIAEVNRPHDPLVFGIESEPNWVFDKTDFTLIGREGVRVFNGVKDMPKVKEKPKAVAIDLRDVLTKQTELQGSHYVCSFGLLDKNGEKHLFPNAPCHAALGYGYKPDIVELALNFTKFNDYIKRSTGRGNAIMEDRIESAKDWMRYIMNKSPWADTFKTKMVHIALEKGILMDVSYSRHIIAGACVALREATEYNNKAIAFTEFKKWKRWDDSVCFLLANALNKTTDGKHFQAIAFGGGHQVFGGSHNAEQLFRFMVEGYDVKTLNKEPFSTHNSSYSIEANIATSKGKGKMIQGWFTERIKTTINGEGWAAEAVVTKENAIQVGDAIAAELQKIRDEIKEGKEDA